MALSLFLIALLGLLVFGLGFYVSLGRQATGTSAGFTSDPADPLYKRVRAHGNAAEYAGVLGLLIYVIGANDPGIWLNTLMVLAVASRYLHAAGLLLGPTLAKPHPLRFAGALGTYAMGLSMVVVVAWWGIVPLAM